MDHPGLQLARVPELPGVGVVSLDGPIDARNVGALQHLLVARGPSAFKTVILDLEQVRYINSIGMSYLVALSDSLEAQGGALYLSTPQPKVKVILEMMGLTEIFKLYASRSSAIRAIQDKRGPVPSKPKAAPRPPKSPSYR